MGQRVELDRCIDGDEDAGETGSRRKTREETADGPLMDSVRRSRQEDARARQGARLRHL